MVLIVIGQGYPAARVHSVVQLNYNFKQYFAC